MTRCQRCGSLLTGHWRLDGNGKLTYVVINEHVWRVTCEPCLAFVAQRVEQAADMGVFLMLMHLYVDSKQVQHAS